MSKKIIINKPFLLLWVIPAAMLILALFHLPYGYYTLLRIVVTVCSAYLSRLEYISTQKISFFVITFGLLALLFNPIIPIYFSKSIWAGIDLLAALIFGIHAYIFHNNFKRS